MTAAEVVSIATADELPIVDISPLCKESISQPERDAIAAAVRKACINTGFFYVSGHGVSTAPFFACMHQLFALPLSDKAKLDAKLSPLHRGYTGLGGSHNCVPEESCMVGPDRKESYLLGELLLGGPSTLHVCGRTSLLKTQGKHATCDATMHCWCITESMVAALTGCCLSASSASC